jgi:tRNA A37 threonylcarbamoyladenosine synthetase subunit TsaC/SUA5/YrdC
VIVEALGNPIISTSANRQEDNLEEQDFGDLDNKSKHRDVDNLPKMELFDYFDKLVDLIVDDGSECHYEVSTILDLTNDLQPQILRQGLGQVPHLSKG